MKKGIGKRGQEEPVGTRDKMCFVVGRIWVTLKASQATREATLPLTEEETEVQEGSVVSQATRLLSVRAWSRTLLGHCPF